MKKIVQKSLVIIISVLMLAIIFGSQPAFAEGEKVYFGSEGYEWDIRSNGAYPLEVHASADTELESVSFDLAYEKTMLEYVSGGELVEKGKVHIEKEDVSSTEFQEMLKFIPRAAGNTTVSIRNAVLRVKDGEEVKLDLVRIPIAIAIPEDCKLSGIQINGREISGFSPEVTEYSLIVKYDVSEIKVTASPSEIPISVTSSDLEVGSNRIGVYASNAEGEKARYVLKINRMEQEEDISQQTQSENENMAEQLREHPLWAVAAGMLVAVFLALLIMKMNMIRRRKRVTQMEERRRQARNAAAQGQDPDRQFKEIVLTNGDYEITTGTLFKDSRRRMPDDHKGTNAHLRMEGALWESEKELTDFTSEDFASASDYLEPDLPEIEVSHVTMAFERDKDEASSLKELAIRTLKGERNVTLFKALDDVSFTVMPGEVVGIIGTNGSGKSTILKIISGVLMPTEGEVKVDRRKIQLLTLGTGFDHELTGRENVYLNGALIGYTKEYIDEKFDDIVAFAELEGFMDEKVKNYSSGMVSRLGFAIATIRNTPEILILDEVLSVGDMFFRKKSEARIQQMIHGGSTVLIVSHSTGVIRKNCTKVVWIEKGKLQAVGDPKTVCDAYEKKNMG